MKTLASLKGLTFSVWRQKGSGRAAPRRDVWTKGSAAEYVDAQLALLVETIEAENRNWSVRQRDGAVEERPAAPTRSRRRPRLVRSSRPRVPGQLLRRLRRWRQQVLSYVPAILLGVTVGVLLGVIFGR